MEVSLCEHKADSLEFRDGQAVVNDMKGLLDGLEAGTGLEPIPDDRGGDVADFNAELELLGPITWHNSPWLYNECYMYRYVQTCFSRRQTHFWKTYDVFAKQKLNGLLTSRNVIIELVQWFLEIDAKNHATGVMAQEDLKALTEEMIQISLWGNATDLLLLISVSVEELQSRQGKKSREMFKENVVDDDTDDVWTLLSAGPAELRSRRDIHIVLDNAGFELVTDLVFAAYLLSTAYGTKVVLHGKSFPWFVSDVTAHDIEVTLDTLTSASFPIGDQHTKEDGSQCLRNFGSLLSRHFESGALSYSAHPFWTTQHSYARMPELAPELYSQLAGAELVVFKGDLNYRKLVFDGLWPHDTPFRTAIGKLGEPARDGLRTLALRTCKADTCVGLQPGRAEEIDPEGTREWTRNGKYGVVSFCDAKSGEQP